MSANLLAWLIGIAWQLHQSSLWAPLSYACVGLCALLCLLQLSRVKKSVSVLKNQSVFARRLTGWALWGTIGFAMTGMHALYVDGTQEVLLGKQDVQIRGIVQPWPKQGEESVRFSVAVEAWRTLPDPNGAEQPDAWTPTRGVVKLSWYAIDLSEIPVAGSRWQLNVRLRAPRGMANPGTFDADLRDWRMRAWGVGYVRQWRDVQPHALDSGDRRRWDTWRQTWRQKLWNSHAPQDGKPWLSALWVGDQTALSTEDWQVLRQTGTAHLMSVSGLHLMVWASIAAAMVGGLWRLMVWIHPVWGLHLPRSGVGFWGTLLLAGGYAALSGWGVPVQRAFCMLIGAMGLRMLAANWSKLAIWLFVACLVLTWDPWAALSAGFWLSFIAVGTLFILPQAQAGAWYDRALGLIWRQAQLSLALAPLSAWWFGQASLVGVIANIVAIPLVSWLILPLTLLGGVVEFAWGWAGDAILALRGVLQWLATWPGAAWVVTPFPAWVALAAVLGTWMCVARVSLELYMLGLWMVVPALIWLPSRPPLGEFEVTALDVGQGTAVWVRTHRHALLFDAGRGYRSGGDVGQQVVVPALRAQGIDLNRLVISHQDNDHMGGAKSVLQAHPNADVLASFESSDTWAGRQSARCHVGQAWVWDGVPFEVLHPVEGQPQAGVRAGNAHSCVLKVGIAERSVLLTGDIGLAQEAEILARDPDLRTQILVAAHHGSATSSGEAWMQQLRPFQTWVQAGYLNPYRHPAKSVTRRWDEAQLDWVSTIACGALTWKSMEPDHPQCWREQNLRYWFRATP